MARRDAGRFRVFAEGPAVFDASARAGLGGSVYGAVPRQRVSRTWGRNSGRSCGSSRRRRVRSGGFRRLPRPLPAERGGRALRHVVEVRHDSFRSPEFAVLLRERGVAVASVDDDKVSGDRGADRRFRLSPAAPLRRGRSRPAIRPPRSTSGPARLRAWSEEGRDCFLYFINGAKIRAPDAAQALIRRLRSDNEGGTS